MKKIISYFLTAIFLVGLSLSFPVVSQAKSSDWKFSDGVYAAGELTYIGKSKKATLPDNTRGVRVIVSDTLEELHIPAKVEAVYLFGCSKLKKVTVSKDNKKLKAIDGILYNKDVTSLESYPYAHPAKKYTVPNTVRRTAAVALGKNVKEVVIHSKLKLTADSYIFSLIGENVEKYTVDKKNPYHSDIDGVLFNKKQTTLLKYPLGRKSVKYTVPKSVTKILDLAFADADKYLKTLVLPDNITQFVDFSTDKYDGYIDWLDYDEAVFARYHKHLTFVVTKNSKTHNTLKGHLRVSGTFVEYGLNLKFKTKKPTVPASKTFLKTTPITLTAPAKTTLYYTTDGTKPTAKNAKTVKPGQSRQVKIWKNTTLKVYAARSSYVNSDIVTRDYKIKSKKPNKTAVPASGTGKKNRKITLKAPANTTLYYTTNGTTPKRASKTYVKPGKTKPITISKKTTLKVMAVKNGCSRSDVVTRVYSLK